MHFMSTNCIKQSLQWCDADKWNSLCVIQSEVPLKSFFVLSKPWKWWSFGKSEFSLVFQGINDMFIQSQQLVTSSSSNNGAVQPKKRKTEHYSSSGGVNPNSGGELSLVEQVFSVTANGHNQNLTSTTIDLNHASPGIGNQQPFVRASTIKLLDTYQRCGQKVGLRVSPRTSSVTDDKIIPTRRDITSPKLTTATLRLTDADTKAFLLVFRGTGQYFIHRESFYFILNCTNDLRDITERNFTCESASAKCKQSTRR